MTQNNDADQPMHEPPESGKSRYGRYLQRYPNDEGLLEHQLWAKGLGELDYPVVEIAESSWAEQVRDEAASTRARKTSHAFWSR
jgi:hypothetical protein